MFGVGTANCTPDPPYPNQPFSGQILGTKMCLHPCFAIGVGGLCASRGVVGFLCAVRKLSKVFAEVKPMCVLTLSGTRSCILAAWSGV